MARAVIVGGGIAGLTCAYRLQQARPADEVVLFERQGRVGGNLMTVERDGFRVECGPNGFLDNNPTTLDLARELGLEDDLVPASDAAGKNRYVLLGGHLHLLPSSLATFLGTDVMSWTAKLHVLLERFRPRRKSFADESVDSFLRRRVGGEIASTLGDAFVTGIFAADPRLLSVQAAFPRLAAFERDHGSILAGMTAARKARKAAAGGVAPRAGRMWSFTRGLQTLIDALTARLRTPPRTETAVTEVASAGRGWRVRSEAGETWEADAVVLCSPSYHQAEVVRGVDGALADDLAGIPYNSIAVVALGYRGADVPHRLEGFGYLSPQRSRRDVLGMQWCSSTFPGRAPAGHVLLRALCGGWNRPEIAGWPDDRLLAAVRREVSQTLRVTADPAFVHVVRWPRAIPQYHVGHLDRVRGVEKRLESHPGLFLGGNPFRGVAINDCVEQAGRLAGKVAGHLAASPPAGARP